MSGREKIWYEGQVLWIRLPDDIDDEEEPDDLWPELMLALECLTEKQRFVIECRYGLKEAGKSFSLDELADYMGITVQAVKQIEERAVSKMRKWVGTR